VPRSSQFSTLGKTVRYSELIMSADKYPGIFSRQMEAIVYITIIVFFVRENNSLSPTLHAYNLFTFFSGY